MSSPERRPRWVYGQGDEPDYQFSFANERTFLAWIRTALAFIAAGVGIDAVDIGLPDPVRIGVSVLLILLGVICALLSWTRWARAERAIRAGDRLPPSALPAFLAISLTLMALVVAARVRFS